MKAYFLIINLILASFAFSFLIGEMGVVRGADPPSATPITAILKTPTSASGGKLFIDTNRISELSGTSYKGVIEVTSKSSNSITGITKTGGEVSIDAGTKIVDKKSVARGTDEIIKSSDVSSTISGVDSQFWGKSVTIGGRNIPVSEALIDPANFNDPELLKTLNAKSITTNSADQKVIDFGGGAKTTISADGKTIVSSTTKGMGWDALLTGVQYAAIWYGLGQMIGSMAGMDKKQTQALSTALAAGSFTYNYFSTLKSGEAYKFFESIGTKTRLTGYGPMANPLIWGIGVAIVVFMVMYKKESKEIVTFSCKPWQAPVGGGDCEKCNKVEGCSDYKCRSLGQACQLLNAGTTEEKCTWVNPKDVSSPIISLWNEVLTKGYKYVPDTAVRPPARGFKIVKTSGDECVKAFTPLEFGVTTNEPAQCRIDYNHTLKFDNMAFWFGESNLYLYNHTQKLALPSPASIQAAAPELQHDGTYTLYIRCQDANGNANVDEFAMRFCVEKGPDTTPPKIEGTSIANNMPVKYNQTSVELEVYVNEPSECKWSREDKSYDNMENLMSCSKNVWEMNNNLVYTCKTTLTGVKDRADNVFYFRCKDQPWLSGTSESSRNVNMQSYKFTLIGTEPLNIIDIKPNGTVKGSTDVVSVWLEVETANGYKNGDAMCYYGETGNEADWIEFFDTGKSLHKQRLDLVSGTYKYYIKCIDLGGNRDDNSTTFKVEVDRQAPIIARVYRGNELLKVITTEDSECRYSTQSCNFKFEDGVDMPYANQKSHVAEWKTESNYYIRCSDEYGNMPISNTCSIIVRPYDVVESVIEL